MKETHGATDFTNIRFCLCRRPNCNLQYGWASNFCSALLAFVENSDITVVSSDLTLAETLVEPNRTKNTELSERRENLWNQPNTGLLPISKDILRMAAKLRAETPGLKLPDAIHASTSLYYGCILFITNDLGFKRIPSLPLILLDQVLASPDY